MTDYRHQQWDDEIEEQQAENRERFWREQAEADEYWRRVAAGEVDQTGDDDNVECEIEDRGTDRSIVPRVPSSGGRPECNRADETPGVATDGRVRPTHADDGTKLDGLRVDGHLPAEGGDQ